MENFCVSVVGVGGVWVAALWSSHWNVSIKLVSLKKTTKNQTEAIHLVQL